MEKVVLKLNLVIDFTEEAKRQLLNYPDVAIDNFFSRYSNEWEEIVKEEIDEALQKYLQTEGCNSLVFLETTVDGTECCWDMIISSVFNIIENPNELCSTIKSFIIAIEVIDAALKGKNILKRLSDKAKKLLFPIFEDTNQSIIEAKESNNNSVAISLPQNSLLLQYSDSLKSKRICITIE
jgi:hypothetical protein